jgi:hypothetical protein
VQFGDSADGPLKTEVDLLALDGPFKDPIAKPSFQEKVISQ